MNFESLNVWNFLNGLFHWPLIGWMLKCQVMSFLQKIFLHLHFLLIELYLSMLYLELFLPHQLLLDSQPENFRCYVVDNDAVNDVD